jgi:molybdopterin molybdotransferase
MSEMDVSDLISVAQAKSIIDATPVTPRTDVVELSWALGHRLSEDLRADRDSPPFEKSVMDGYAVRAEDLAHLPCELLVQGRIMAGQAPAAPISAGKTMAIMTGAPLPDGADTVVPIELVEVLDAGKKVRFTQPVAKGKNVAHRASEIKGGDVVLKGGDLLEAAQIAVAASIGAVEVPVFAKPSVGVLASGDELVEISEIPTGAQIRSSNSAMLLALLERLNCNPTDVGIARDDPAKVKDAITLGMNHDVLLITGGMSVGEHDFVPRVLREMGAQMKITKLRVRPGKPFIFAIMPQGTLVFGLPGNPVSAFVCTLVLVRRMLEKLSGVNAQDHSRIATLTKPLEANGPREFYQPAIFDGKTIAPPKWVGSADIYTLARANALLVRPENDSARAPGEQISFVAL